MNIYILFDGLTYNTRGYFASNEQNAGEYYMLNHRIRDLLLQKGVILPSSLFGKSVSKKIHHLSFRALANDVNSTKSRPNVLYLIV